MEPRTAVAPHSMVRGSGRVGGERGSEVIEGKAAEGRSWLVTCRGGDSALNVGMQDNAPHVCTEVLGPACR
jgi:hypothetical protein